MANQKSKLETSLEAKHQRASSTVWMFLGGVATFLTVIYFLASGTLLDLRFASKVFYSLHETAKGASIDKFLEDKRSLQGHVKANLKKSPTSQEASFALNVAVYLFPELLPGSNFEKQIAIEQWGNFQKKIEEKPKSPESRIWFEELRANIWNYENTDRQTPRLSAYAKEAIRIYDALSTP